MGFGYLWGGLWAAPWPRGWSPLLWSEPVGLRRAACGLQSAESPTEPDLLRTPRANTPCEQQNPSVCSELPRRNLTAAEIRCFPRGGAKSGDQAFAPL